jgi:hypothetical protein
MLLVSAALCATASPAAADYIKITSYSTAYSDSSISPGSPKGSVPLYDPTQFGGTRLDRVEFSFDLTGTGGFLVVTNQSDAFNQVHIDFAQRGNLYTSSENGSGPEVQISTFSGPAGSFDQLLDPGGRSVLFMPQFRVAGSPVEVDPAAFVGTGNYQFTTMGQFSVDIGSTQSQGPISVAYSPDYFISGTITVNYLHATPAPPGLILAATAIPLLAVLRHRFLAPR